MTVIVIAAEIVLLRLVARTSLSAFKECQVCVEPPWYSPINIIHDKRVKVFSRDLSLPLSGHEGACISAAFSRSHSSSSLSSCNIIIVNKDIRYQEPFCDIYVKHLNN